MRDKLYTSPQTPISNTTSPSLSSGSVSTMHECEKTAASAHAEAIKAAVAANTKLSPDPRVVQMAIAAFSDRVRGTPPPPGSSPQYVHRYPRYAPLEPPPRRSPPGFPYQPPPRRFPPGFPGTNNNDYIYQEREYCQYCGPVCDVGNHGFGPDDYYG